MGRDSIDRIQARAALHRAWEASSEAGNRVFVCGPEGTGKSRLVDDFVAPVEAVGGTVVLVRARAADGSRPWTMLTSIAYEIVTEDFDEASLDASRALLHVIATHDDTADAVMVAATQRLLAALSATGRLVVIIDDAERADAATIRTLARVTLPPGTMLVVVTSEPTDPTLADLLPASRRVTLEPLTVDEIAIALARAIGEPDVAMAAEIHRASSGKPDLAAALIELARARHHLSSWTERSEAHVVGLLARASSEEDEKITSFVERFAQGHDVGKARQEQDDDGKPERPTFWNDGSTWVVTYDGSRCVVPDTRGVRCLAHLIANPFASIHVYELPAAGSDARGAPPTGIRPADGDPGPLLDSEATAKYRQRIRDLSEELEEAERFNDPHRGAKLRAELEQLTQMLTTALGLGGKSRRHRWEAERARVAATKAIRSTISRLATMHEGLGAHLHGSIRTGFFCSYEPTEDGRGADLRESHDAEFVPSRGYTDSPGVTP